MNLPNSVLLSHALSPLYLSAGLDNTMTARCAQHLLPGCTSLVRTPCDVGHACPVRVRVYTRVGPL